MRKAQEAQANAKLYAQNITAMISRIAASVHPALHPLFEIRTPIKKVLVLVFTSDKGLCGAFNNNANKQVLSWVKENEAHEKIDISFCGKRGYLFFRKRFPVKMHYENVTSKPQFSNAIKIGQELSQSFIRGEYDEIYLSYNQFFSPISQKTIFEKILPIDPKALIKDKVEKASDYIFEPEISELLSFLIPHFLYFKIYFALLENSAGEHGARMSAMDNATKNASELKDHYTLLRNRARQAEITTELTEIVSGAEALR